jgi:ribose-phosphate pyrophosphokinase
LSGDQVRAERVVGDVRGRRPLLIDDMISTGGTIEAAANSLIAAGCIPEMTVAATHGLLVGNAPSRLSALPIRRLITTDSVSRSSTPSLPVDVVGIGSLLGEAIDRLHEGRSMADLVDTW